MTLRELPYSQEWRRRKREGNSLTLCNHSGTCTMKYSQKLQPGSVLFSLKVLMSSSNLPRFFVKDIRSNVLSLVRKAFQDSWVREESFKGSESTTHLWRHEQTVQKTLQAQNHCPTVTSAWDANRLPPSSPFLPSVTGEKHQAGDETSDGEMVSLWAGLRPREQSVLLHEGCCGMDGGLWWVTRLRPCLQGALGNKVAAPQFPNPRCPAHSKASLGSLWLTD